MDLHSRTGKFSVAFLLVMALGGAPALALDGKVRYEAPYKWRGVAARVWVYPWVEKSPDGRHVSSVYIHHWNYDPYPYDGYNDALVHDYRHMEAGLAHDYGGSPYVFWQWNRTSYGLVDWQQDAVVTYPGSGFYVDLEINNADMGVDDWDNWRMSYNGNIMCRVYMPLIYGYALCSSERRYREAAYDDNRSSFRDLKKRDANGNWFLWTNSTPIADTDGYYYAWDSYSASHWFTYKYR